MKVSIVFLLIASFLLHTDAYIVIKLDPEDVERVSDFFQSLIVLNHPKALPTPSCCTRYLKKTVIGMVQMNAVMLSLVGSNIITDLLKPHLQHYVDIPSISESFVRKLINETCNKQCTTPKKNFKEYLKGPSAEACNKEFGCDDNMCWRTCHTGDPKKIMWCYTGSKANRVQVQFCKTDNDCSNCWECVEACHP